MNLVHAYLIGVALFIIPVMGAGLPEIMRRGGAPFLAAFPYCMLYCLLWPITVLRIILRTRK